MSGENVLIRRSFLKPYLKSLGRRSVRLHLLHSAMFLSLPFSMVFFITISPPQEHRNFWVETVVRAFLLTAMLLPP
jgi:hypothetical protein